MLCLHAVVRTFLDTYLTLNLTQINNYFPSTEYTGSITVPCLWDKQKKTIVNNESSEIIRMFNKELNAFCKTEEQRNLDLYPEDLRAKIDDINEWVYP